MRMAPVVLAAVLLSGCNVLPSVQPVQLGSATADAAARAEFTIVPAAKRMPFPTWNGSDLDGYAWSNATLGRNMALVNFWASWCEPCRQEWPELQAAAAGHPSVRFLGVNSMDERRSARGFIRNHPTDYRHLDDPKAILLKSLQGMPNSMLPTTIILDRRHRIAAWKSGPVMKGQIRRALATLLNASRATR